MKKIFLLTVILAGLSSCTSTSKAKQVRFIDWSRVPEVKFTTLKALVEHYSDLRSTDFNLNVREINLSAVVLKEIAAASNKLKLIMGANEKNNVVIVVERIDKSNIKHRYYLTDLFKDEQTGSDWLPPLCSLEPALCTPIFRRASAGSEISLSTAKSMSERYYGLSKIDATKIILQINLEPEVLLNLIGANENVKLLSAIDRNRGDSNTLILEFMNGSQVSYFDLKSRIPNPVCPPPPRCDLSEF